MSNKKGNDNSFIQKVKNIDEYFQTKNFLTPCVEAFQTTVLKSNNYFDLRDQLFEHCLVGTLQDTLLRPIAWRIFLGILPCDIVTTLSDWVDIVRKNRLEYMKKKARPPSKKMLDKGDPLTKDGQWGSYFDDQSLRKVIDLDIQRTYQNKVLFCEQSMKDLLINILFVWSKENSYISYRQGMNEILALLVFAMFPFYFPFGNKEDSINLITKEMLSNPIPNARTIYAFFHDEGYFEADLYTMFNEIMKEGVTSLYMTKKVNKDAKSIELFDDIYSPNDYNNENADWIYRRCGRVMRHILEEYDNDLYTFFNKNKVDCATFMQRWLKCFFCREFHPKDAIILWDAILTQERVAIINKTNKDFEFIDYIAVAMLVYIKDLVIGRDPNDCLLRLFKYPPVESPFTLVKLAMKIQNNIKLRKEAEKVRTENNKIIKGGSTIKEDIQKPVIKKDNRTQFQKNFIPLPDSIYSFLNSKASQDKEFVENIKKQISNQNKEIINKLDDIKNRYKDKYSKEDSSDFEFIIDILKKKLV